MDQRLLRVLEGKTEHYPHALEKNFPRVFGKIMALWDSPNLQDYFMDLVVDKRGGRVGFPPDVAAELVHLSLVHAAQHKPQTSNDAWDVSPEAFLGFGSSPSAEKPKVWRELPASIFTQIESTGVRCSLEGFLRAAESGNRAALGLFLTAKVNTEIRNERGWTALMLAAFHGHAEAVDLLLSHDANVFASDNGGNTALHWAAFSGQVNCARLLVEHHADVDARSAFGWTPLLQATARRHLEIVMLLINFGANLDATEQDGNTALHQAAASGYAEIIRPLLAHQADTKLKNSEGDTPVKLAIKNGHELAIKLLLSAPQAAA